MTMGYVFMKVMSSLFIYAPAVQLSIVFRILKCRKSMFKKHHIIKLHKMTFSLVFQTSSGQKYLTFLYIWHLFGAFTLWL